MQSPLTKFWDVVRQLGPGMILTGSWSDLSSYRCHVAITIKDVLGSVGAARMKILVVVHEAGERGRHLESRNHSGELDGFPIRLILKKAVESHSFL